MISLIEPLQLREKNRRLQLREGIGMIPTVAINLSPLPDFRRRSQQGASTSGAEEFAAAKTDHADVAPGSGLPPFDHGAWHLTGVFNHPEAVFTGDLDDPFHWDHASMKMGDQDGAGIRTDCFADQFRIEVPVVWIKINQDGPCANGDDIVEIPDKIIAGQNDFVAWPNL